MSFLGLLSLISAAAYWFAGWFLFHGTKRLSAPQSASTGRKRPVAVIIPARNEEKSLPRLLKSLRDQTTPAREIIVVDDGSTDRTAEVAGSYGCTVIAAGDKPDEWTGKSWACWNGAAAASSQLLVFLDADVWCGPDALRRLERAYDTCGGLVSVQPKHVTREPYEQISAFFNIVSVAAAGSRGGFGPCMACSREDYFALGGHEAIRSSVVDDFSLARHFTRNGKKATPFLGGAEFEYRMYPGGLSDLGDGWTKNMAAGLGLSSPLSAVLIFIWFTGIINLVISIAASAAAPWVPAVIASVALFALYVVQVTILLARVGRFHFVTALFFPLFLLFFLVIFFISAVLTVAVGRVRWKGRIIRLR